MLTYVVFAGLCVLATVILFLPGACVLSVFRVRPLALLGASPVLTVFMVTVATVLLERAGVAWNRGTASAALVLIMAVLLPVEVLRRRRRGCAGTGVRSEGEPSDEKTPEGESSPRGESLGTVLRRLAIATAPAALLQGGLVLRIMGRTDAILQNHDVMFHLNLIEEIGATGDASVLTSSWAISGSAFYPSTFHALAALLLGLADVPTAFNAELLCLGAVLLPASLVLLTRAIGLRWWTCSLAGLLGITTMWMPGFTFFYNGQAPAGLAAALIPGALTVLFDAARTVRPRTLILLGGALSIGLTAAHPGGGQWLVVTACALGAIRAFARLAMGVGGRTCAAVRRSLSTALLCLLPLVVICTIPQLQRMADFKRVRPHPQQSLTEILLLAPQEGPPLLYAPLILLAVIGVVHLLRRRHWALPVVWACAAGLTALAFFPVPPLSAFTGGWWADPSRFLSVLVLVVGVLAAVGCQALVERIAGEGRRWRAAAAVLVPALATILAAASVAFNDVWVRHGYDEASLAYSPWVSDEEQDLLEGDMRYLFDGAVVFGAPNTGAGLIPVLTDGRSMNRTIIIDNSNRPEQRYLGYHFRNIATDKKVCDIIRAQSGTPLYYEDSDVDPMEIYWLYPGYYDVDTSVGFEEIARIDTAVVYRITACDEVTAGRDWKGRPPSPRARTRWR